MVSILYSLEKSKNSLHSNHTQMRSVYMYFCWLVYRGRIQAESIKPDGLAAGSREHLTTTSSFLSPILPLSLQYVSVCCICLSAFLSMSLASVCLPPSVCLCLLISVCLSPSVRLRLSASVCLSLSVVSVC